MSDETPQLIAADRAHLWHPFTQMREWCAAEHEPLGLGGIGIFHHRFAPFQFPVEHVASIEELENLDAARIAAVAIEPLIQGAAGMRLWPRGLLARLRAWCDRTRALLIADEIMTGFG